MSGREKIREQLSAYLDGELSEGESRLVDEMVAADPTLSAELESLRLVQSMVRSLPTAQATAGMTDAVLERAQRRHVGRHSDSPVARWRLGHLAQAAIVLLAVGVGVTVTAWLNRPTHPQQTERQTPYPSETPVFTEGRIAEVGGPATAETTNVFINTDNLLLAQREVEHVFGKNSIKLIVEIVGVPAGTPKADAESRGRANFYNQTQVTPNQVRYEVAITDNQMRQIVSELNGIRARQNVAQMPMRHIKEADALVRAEDSYRYKSVEGKANRDARNGKSMDMDVKKDSGESARLDRSGTGVGVAIVAGQVGEVASQPALASATSRPDDSARRGSAATKPSSAAPTTMPASTVAAQQSLPYEAGNVHEQGVVRRRAGTTPATTNVRQLVVILNAVGKE